MAELVPFKLRLTGDTADEHHFQGYDGYNAMAGFAWTLALVTNYAETGEIRHRGTFLGREAVRAGPPTQGSVVADFWVQLSGQISPALAAAGIASAAAGAPFLIGLTRRVLAVSIGHEVATDDPELAQLADLRGGDIDALVAATEPSVRRTHDVIGRGATEIDVLGGFNIIGRLDRNTQAYVNSDIRDNSPISKEVSVASFNANTGHGAVYDYDHGRVIPISMSREVLLNNGHIFSWGLDQYARRTNGRIRIKFLRVLAMDDRPKRYVILEAEADR